MPEYGLGSHGDGRIIDAIHAHHPSQVNPIWIGYTPTLITAPGALGGYVVSARYQIINKKTVLFSSQLWITTIGAAAGQSVGISLPNKLTEIESFIPQGVVFGTIPNWTFHGVVVNSGGTPQGMGFNGYIANTSLNNYGKAEMVLLNNGAGFAQDDTIYVLNGFYGIK